MDYTKNENLTEEEMKLLEEEKEKFDKEVNRIANTYKKLDMDEFVNRIGGQEVIDRMKRINEKGDKIVTRDGVVVERGAHNEKSADLEEWKRGFMEGYDEAYRRLMSK